MAILVKIEGATRTDIIQTSISWSQQLTKDPSILSFDIYNSGQTLPDLGDTVTVEIDSDVKFSGTITSKKRNLDKGLIERVAYEAKDGFHTLDRRLVIKAYANQSASDIVTDIIDTFTTGFTYTNVIPDAPEITTIRFNYEQPSSAIKQICSAIGWDWYIDADNDVHFFPQNYNVAPFSLTDDNGNLVTNSLEIDRNIVNLKNAIYVRGGEYSEAISASDAFDKYVADGTQNSWPLIYRYKNVQVTLDGVAQTVGIDNIDNPASFNCLYNFQEKLVKWPEASKPTVGKVIRVFGDAQIPLIVQAIDEESILAYGTFEYVIVDKSIQSVEEAEMRALSVINDFANASHEGYFQTLTDGLVCGQYITITSTLRGVSDTYKITSINAKVYDATHFIYKVKFLKSGQVSFFDILEDLLAERRKNIVINEDEVIQRLISIEEDALTVTDEITETSQTSPPYTWQVGAGTPIVWNFWTWS